MNITWTSPNERTVISLWGQNLGDQFDWKNIGPPIGFHYAVPGGMGPGEAGRGLQRPEAMGPRRPLQLRQLRPTARQRYPKGALSGPLFLPIKFIIAKKTTDLSQHL